MSWDGYVDNLMGDGTCEDVAIVGYGPNNKSVWASKCGGAFSKITPQEIDTLVSQSDRESFFTKGLTLGSVKCSVIRDGFKEGEVCPMDLKVKGEGPKYSIAVAKSDSALVIAMAKDGVHGGAMNQKTHAMAQYLKQQGF